MHATIDLPEDLLRKGKEISARTRRSVSAVVSDAVRESFARRAQPNKHVELPAWRPPEGAKDTWLKPGFDLDHMADFWEKLEAAEQAEAERESHQATGRRRAEL